MPAASDYGVIERALHHIAFSHPFFQKLLADIENDVYSRQLKNIVIDRPVFVTSLPRAGTTLVLELLYNTGEFASFTYRQMPFVLAPLLWNRLSSGFQKSQEKRERAHGDGVEISFDSPEAFEEVLWLAFLENTIMRENILNPIAPGDLSDEFVQAFRQLIRKLLLLQVNRGITEKCRYLSKNNANISRIHALRSMFPDARIIVPFRNPLTHVRSLMHQHEKFLKEHAQDKFSRKYMRWIGHFDFGENFKPIDFDGTYGSVFTRDTVDIDFWFDYWIRAYRSSLEQATENVHFIDFDAMLADGEAALGRLGHVLGMSHPGNLVAGARSLRKPGSRPILVDDVSAPLRSESQTVYQELRERGI